MLRIVVSAKLPDGFNWLIGGGQELAGRLYPAADYVGYAGGMEKMFVYGMEIPFAYVQGSSHFRDTPLCFGIPVNLLPQGDKPVINVGMLFCIALILDFI